MNLREQYMKSLLSVHRLFSSSLLCFAFFGSSIVAGEDTSATTIEGVQAISRVPTQDSEALYKSMIQDKTGITAVDTNLSWDEYKAQTMQIVTRMHGWCTPEKATRMMELVKSRKPETFVEVGVYGGRSVLPVVAAMQYVGKGVGYAIDSWEVDPAVTGLEQVNQEWWSQIDLISIMNDFISWMKVAKLQNRYSLIKTTSKLALPLFGKRSIDLLHIDGNHSEESAYFDATNWLPKVKKGGVIIFDDANWPQTQKAVKYILTKAKMEKGSKMGDPYLVFIKK